MRQMQNGKKGIGVKADLEKCEQGRRVRDLNGPPSK